MRSMTMPWFAVAALFAISGSGTSARAAATDAFLVTCPGTAAELGKALDVEEHRLQNFASSLRKEDFAGVKPSSPSEKVRVEVLAPDALPKDLLFRDVHLRCRGNYLDFRKSLKSGDLKTASEHLGEWTSCLEDVYQTLPPAAKAISKCYAKLKQ